MGRARGGAWKAVECRDPRFAPDSVSPIRRSDLQEPSKPDDDDSRQVARDRPRVDRMLVIPGHCRFRARAARVAIALLVVAVAGVATAATTHFAPLRAEATARLGASPPPETRKGRRDARALERLVQAMERETDDVVADLKAAHKVAGLLGRRFGGDPVFASLVAALVAAMDHDVDVGVATARGVHGGDGGRVDRILASAERQLARSRAANRPRQAISRLRRAAQKTRQAARALVPRRLSAAEVLRNPRTTIAAAAATEGSGLAFVGGAFWTHGDSGTGAVLHRSPRLDFAGAETLSVPGVVNVDWEDLAVLDGDLLVCDIGDNTRTRDDIAVHRVRYEAPGEEPARVELVASYPLAYPDGPHDAEAAVVLDGALHVVIKRRGEAATTVFRFPELRAAEELAPGERNVAEVAATLDLSALDLVTAAAVDTARSKIALLTYTRVVVYPLDELAGAPTRSIPLKLQFPPLQYEALELAGGWLFATTEGGEVLAVSEVFARD